MGRVKQLVIVNTLLDEYLLTFALLGGVVETPLRFFPDCPKTAARSAAVFGTPYYTSFPHML